MSQTLIFLYQTASEEKENSCRIGRWKHSL